MLNTPTYTTPVRPPVVPQNLGGVEAALAVRGGTELELVVAEEENLQCVRLTLAGPPPPERDRRGVPAEQGLPAVGHVAAVVELERQVRRQPPGQEPRANGRLRGVGRLVGRVRHVLGVDNGPGRPDPADQQPGGEQNRGGRGRERAAPAAEAGGLGGGRPGQEPALEPAGHRDGRHGRGHGRVEPVGPAGGRAAPRTPGQVPVEGGEVVRGQFRRAAGAAEADEPAGRVTVHRRPSPGCRPRVPPGARVPAASSSWPGPAGTSPCRSAGPSARRCRGS